MTKLKVDAEGNVLDAEGNPLIVNDEPVKLTDIDGAKSQRDIDVAVQSRVARLDRQIETLKAQADKTPELERLIETLKGEKAEGEKQIEAIQASARSESEAQVARIQVERDKFRSDLESERAARVRDQVSTLLLEKAGNTFVSPKIDIVPHLLGVHKREEEKGADGKGTGKFLDYFKMPVKKDGTEDEYEEKFVPAEKALQLWAETYPHHVRPSGNAGSGGGGTHQGIDAGNPWNKQHWNITKQQELMANDRGKARSLMTQAGVAVPASL